MKIPNKPGRRELLAALAAVGFLPSKVAAAPRWTEEEYEHDLTRYRLHLVGQSGTESSLDSPLTCAVAEALESCLAVDKGEASRLELIRSALKDTFRTGVSESALIPEYILIWIDGHWERVCLDQIQIQVAFGRAGTVQLAVAVDEML